MLQQTRVATVAPRYEAFLRCFPSPAAMAAAGEEEVLAEWSGLGYYRRARNLHAAAKKIASRHGGEVPETRADLLALPGIGDYTAGAVLSIAFHRPEPIVDGNVERVLSRLFFVRGNVRRNPARRVLRELAEEAVRGGPPAEVNQALMELGAVVCLPARPLCEECPVSGLCVAREEGSELDLPELPARPEAVETELAVALVRRGDRVLLARAPEGGFLAGTWGPPFAELPGPGAAAELAGPLLRERYGLTIAIGEPMGTVAHAITHHRIRARCFAARLRGGAAGDRARLVPLNAVGSMGLSSLAAKAIRLLQ